MNEEHARPRVFIGSAVEAHDIARQIQSDLEGDADSTLWDQNVFSLSTPALESLLAATETFDFAVLVLTPNHVLEERGRVDRCPRDNILFEFGLFMGALGIGRTFLVHCREDSIELPTDLKGIAAATFSRGEDGDLRAAVGPVCARLREAFCRAQNATPAPRRMAARERLPVAQRERPSDGASRPAAPRLHSPKTARGRRRRSLGRASTSGLWESYRIANVSTTGALLEAASPIPLGRMLDLRIVLENRQTVFVAAEVVRIQQPAWGVVGGVGVRFTDFTDGSERVIQDYVFATDTVC